jgi:hypothetical protein
MSIHPQAARETAMCVDAAYESIETDIKDALKLARQEETRGMLGLLLKRLQRRRRLLETHMAMQRDETAA